MSVAINASGDPVSTTLATLAAAASVTVVGAAMCSVTLGAIGAALTVLENAGSGPATVDPSLFSVPANSTSSTGGNAAFLAAMQSLAATLTAMGA